MTIPAPRFTFESTFPDGSPRRYVGIHRPTEEEIRRQFDGASIIQTSGGTLIYANAVAVRAALSNGTFDRNLYAIEDDERGPS